VALEGLLGNGLSWQLALGSEEQTLASELEAESSKQQEESSKH